MFYIDSTVNVESSGKPLPSSGSWGAQTQFPGGVPQPCVKARIPCVRVVYRVTELNVVCEWTLGMVGVALPQPDGTIARATRSLVLDENDAAAHYTVRKAWSQGEAMPRPTQVQNPAYPKIAVDAKVGGVVAVRLIVGPDGSIKSVVPIAGPAMLQVAVVEAVRHWKFDPLSIGQQPTSFQLDEQFAYNAPKANTFAGMDPSGRVMLPTTDAHQDPGFHADGASSGQWAACSAVTCTHAAPDVPPSK
jgi:TonB family protein